MKQPSGHSIWIAGCVFLVLLLGWIGSIVFAASRKPVPANTLICQLGHKKEHVSFLCPEGDHFQLVIGVPFDAAHIGTYLVGTIKIGIGTQVSGSIDFDTRSSQPANWLENEGLNAFIVTWSKESPMLLLNKCAAGKTKAAVQIDLQDASTDSGSLWLSYMAPAKW